MIREQAFLKLERSFGQEPYTVVPNFLDSMSARQVLRSIQEITTRGLWFKANSGDPEAQPKKSSSMQPGLPAYTFGKYPVYKGSARTMAAIDSTRHDIFRIRDFKGDLLKEELGKTNAISSLAKVLASATVRSRFERAVKMKIDDDVPDINLTRYGRGDFCSPHDDYTSWRSFTFLLHLTPDWLPHWGGQLAILDKDNFSISHALNPSFNTLIAFPIPLPHCVLPVSVYCPAYRYTLGGWFNRRER
jgi:hypothetical protein